MPAKTVPAVTELPGPHAWLELRDAASAARLAVQMLGGPLAPWNDPAPDEARLREVIGALEQATRRVCSLVTTLQPSANERPVARTAPATTVVDPIAPTNPIAIAPTAVVTNAIAPIAAPTNPIPAPTKAVATTPGRSRSRRGGGPTVATEVDTLLHQLEITTLTRSDPPVLLSVHAAPQLHTAFDRTALLQALGRLVDDAAGLGPAIDTTVMLRAYLDPVEELGDAMDLVFEIRPDARAPAAALAWAPTSAAEMPPGAMLSSRTIGGHSCAILRVPALVRGPLA